MESGVLFIAYDEVGLEAHDSEILFIIFVVCLTCYFRF